MLKKTKTEHMKMLKECIHYLNCVDIYGSEAKDLSACIEYLKAWVEVSKLKPPKVRAKRKKANK